MQQFIKEVARGKRGSIDLSYEQAKEAATLITSGQASDVQIAALFIGERIKTETADELLGFIHAFREQIETISVSNEFQDRVIDFASPYAGRNSFFATIPVSLLLAERGIPAFLHCSDTLPPKFGTTIADVLNELSIPIANQSKELANTLEHAHIAFAKAEYFSKPLANIKQIRHDIGVRTIMNTVEKLLNFSNASSIMMGAFHRTAINKIVPIFKDLPFKNVYVVQGIEGSEDVPVHRNSFVYRIEQGEMESFIVNPKEYGLYVEEKWFEKKISIAQQAEYIERLLNGEHGEDLTYVYNQVVFNAGLRYYLFGYEPTIEEAITYAKNQLSNQRGKNQFEKWKQASQMYVQQK
ncbi:anthranilate phosphoribosyltransferase [Priestia megaterium]|nr:anthranilate phosphoribosyltransferase [Priestia megaterium]